MNYCRRRPICPGFPLTSLSFESGQPQAVVVRTTNEWIACSKSYSCRIPLSKVLSLFYQFIPSLLYFFPLPSDLHPLENHPAIRQTNSSVRYFPRYSFPALQACGYTAWARDGVYLRSRLISTGRLFFSSLLSAESPNLAPRQWILQVVPNDNPSSALPLPSAFPSAPSSSVAL